MDGWRRSWRCRGTGATTSSFPAAVHAPVPPAHVPATEPLPDDPVVVVADPAPPGHDVAAVGRLSCWAASSTTSPALLGQTCTFDTSPRCFICAGQAPPEFLHRRPRGGGARALPWGAALSAPLQPSPGPHQERLYLAKVRKPSSPYPKR